MIRLRRPEDMTQLIAIWRQASVYADEYMPAAVWWYRQEQIVKQLEADTEVWIQFDTNNEMIGFLAIRSNEIIELFVRPEYRGVAQTQELMDWVRTHYPVLYHRVCVENHQEVEFYLQQGFSIKETRVHPIWKLEEHWMERQVPQHIN